MRGWPTLTHPTEVLASQLQNKDVYSILISRLFTLEGNEGAFPHAFEGGEYEHLLDAVGDDACRAEVRRVFTSGHTEAMTRSVRQTVWQTKTCGLLIGRRNGGDGLCPICLALGQQEAETHEHRCIDCPISSLVWRHALHAWGDKFSSAWATAAAAPGALSREARRLPCLG